MKRNFIAWLWAPLIALQFFTRIPIRFIPDSVYAEDGGREKSFAFYPLVGVVVGLAGAGIMVVCHDLGLPKLASAILTIAVTVTITGALHEDGFADVADGLGPHDRDDALKAMRDSRIGSFGAIALWALLSLKAIALSSIAFENVGKAIIAAHVLARWSSLPMSKVPPEAQSTSGLGAQMAAAITLKSIALGTLLSVLIVIPALGIVTGARSGIAAVVVIVFTGLFYRSRFGGVTGDCLGATNQIIEVVTLFIVSRNL